MSKKVINSKNSDIASEINECGLDIAILLINNRSSNSMNYQKMKIAKISVLISEESKCFKNRNALEALRNEFLSGLFKYYMNSHIRHIVTISLHEVGM